MSDYIEGFANGRIISDLKFNGDGVEIYFLGTDRKLVIKSQVSVHSATDYITGVTMQLHKPPFDE